MNVLYIAPVSPPITGQSIAANVLLDYLTMSENVNVVDLSLASTNDGRFTWVRAFEVLKILYLIRKSLHSADFIYLTISESMAGNLKDLLIYLVCRKKLDKVYIQLHGGSIKKEVFDRYPFLKKLNELAIKKMAGVFVSGESHMSIFSSMVESSRLHIVGNFAEDYLFVDEKVIKKKFLKISTLKIIYISGMTSGKGYLSLLKAYQALDDNSRNLVEIDFAGKFDTAEEEGKFTQEIEFDPRLRYHGVVDDENKRRLFAKAHVFCLPTTFLEGQPISILEAYASGCVVLTTGQPGILDIFSGGINGYEISKNDHLSIKSLIEKLIVISDNLIDIALNNSRTATSNYRTDTFSRGVSSILLSSSDKNVSTHIPIIGF